MERVIGLGGPFIKANDPKGLAAWYEKHLGISFKGATYTDWPLTNNAGSNKPGYNVLSFFKSDSDYFAPSEKQVMVNFIVKDLFALIDVLKAEGVTIIGEPLDEAYGKFGWILDPEGNKIELWEPPDSQ
ncbi:MAG: VOC family protein [Chitinophagaceae bacterium]|nr:VOC family protein [Chitinophagaceae bacterium]MBL0130089.1 VOC family protein [Chitinophagaceae bacterium]